MNNSSALVINTQGLTKTFKGVNALQSLDLKVPKNSIFGFLGPSGAGKTTTIKLLLGLARPTGGSATIFGLDSVNDSTEIRKRVGYLAQDPRFYEGMTARDTLRFTARLVNERGWRRGFANLLRHENATWWRSRRCMYDFIFFDILGGQSEKTDFELKNAQNSLNRVQFGLTIYNSHLVEFQNV